jgi:hypothetical protein
VVLQAELQQDIQRFATKFTARVLDALAPLQSSPHPEVREAAMRQMLLYSASALDIATEPQPELGLLDMIVFVTLSRRIVDIYWAPKVFGEKGGGSQAWRSPRQRFAARRQGPRQGTA